MDAATAALEVRKQVKDLHILIIGAFFPEFPKNDGVATRFGFPATYFNMPDQNDLAGIYASATVFVSASWQEGFGMPGLEALACGTSLITTDSGGMHEYAKADETAILVPPQNTRALIAAIHRVLESSELRRELTKNGRKKAAQYSWGKALDKLEQHFQQKSYSHKSGLTVK